MSRWRGLAALSLCLSVVAGAAGCSSKSSSDDHPTTTSNSDAAPSVAKNALTTFPSGDVSLSGQLFGTRKGQAALLVNASTTDMRSMFPLAQRLAKEGLVVLAFDRRGYGQSGGAKDPSTDTTDIAAALEFLHSRGNAPVGVVGVEDGGTASVIAAADDINVNALVAIDSGPTSGAVDATDAARKLNAATLVFSDGSDGGDQLAGMIAAAELRRGAQPRDPATDTALQDEVTAFLVDRLGLAD
jgi:pimeloyl-ACP methyl ester carboxylesterase